MPIFEFRCAKCDYEFERIQKRDENPPPCPKCGFGSYKKISAGKFRLKGDGFYKEGMN